MLIKLLLNSRLYGSSQPYRLRHLWSDAVCKSSFCAFTEVKNHCVCGCLRRDVHYVLDRQLVNYWTRRSLSTSSLQQQSGKPPKINPNDKDDDDGDEDKKALVLKAFLWMTTAWMVVVLLSYLRPQNVQDTTSMRFVSWNEFLHFMLAAGEVEELVVHSEMELVTITLYEGAIINGRKVENRVFQMQIPDVKRFEEQLRKAENSLGIPPEKGVSVVYERNYDTVWLLLFGLVIVSILTIQLLRGQGKGGLMGGPLDIFSQLRKAKFRLVDPVVQVGSPQLKFSDVAGLHEAKIEIKEFVDYLQRPEAFTKLGAKLPKGALLTGPPGCGKTLLAKAVATEASVPFLAVNGTEFVEMIGGLGAARVRDLFAEAKRRAPCIIYIDEIDALGRKRSGSSQGMSGGSSEEEQTLNQLLVELDGMDTAQGVIVLASTNREDILDKALLRRGRFDRHVNIDLPTRPERVETFELYLKKIKNAGFDASMVDRLARMTPGFTGADICNVCNEAALHAATDGKKAVEEADIMYAMEKILAGAEKKSSSVSQLEKLTIAYHESGHALVGWLLKYTDALLKITIVPRTGSVRGFAQYNPADRKLLTREELFDKMCMTLGGRAAESVVFNQISTGAEDDLRRVTRSAYDQIRIYGMNDKVGPISFFVTPGEEHQSDFAKKPYSKKLQALIDEEARALATKAYNVAEEIIRDNRDKLQLLADELLRKETLVYDDVKRLIGPPLHGPKKAVEAVEAELPTSPEEPEQSFESKSEERRPSEERDED